jgi:hypothetical protein
MQGRGAKTALKNIRILREKRFSAALWALDFYLQPHYDPRTCAALKD